MKKLFSATLFGCLLVFMFAASADAQIVAGTSMRASIPFNFIINGKSLPAGKYEISRVVDEPTGLLIRNVDDKRDHAIFATEPVEEATIPHRSLLVFHNYGESYFLSEVVAAGAQRSGRIVPTHAERTLLRELASSDARPGTVFVALN